MADTRELLDEIEKRDAKARRTPIAEDPWTVRNSALDVSRLVATVRAVLDRHNPWGGVQSRCVACNYMWPCPDYRNVRDALVKSDG